MGTLRRLAVCVAFAAGAAIVGVTPAHAAVQPTRYSAADLIGSGNAAPAGLKATAQYLVATGSSPQSTTCFLVTAIWSNANGKAVAAEFGGATTSSSYGMLRARSEVPGLWESWNVCRDAATRRTLIQSNAINSPYYGRYVTAELGYTGNNYGMLRARSTTAGPWEEFNTSSSPCGVCSMTIVSRANSRLVSAELAFTGANNGMLRARATAVGAYEQFTW